jgi:hypothetical protein
MTPTKAGSESVIAPAKVPVASRRARAVIFPDAGTARSGINAALPPETCRTTTWYRPGTSCGNKAIPLESAVAELENPESEKGRKSAE